MQIKSIVTVLLGMWLVACVTSHQAQTEDSEGSRIAYDAMSAVHGALQAYDTGLYSSSYDLFIKAGALFVEVGDMVNAKSAYLSASRVALRLDRNKFLNAVTAYENLLDPYEIPPDDAQLFISLAYRAQGLTAPYGLPSEFNFMEVKR